MAELAALGMVIALKVKETKCVTAQPSPKVIAFVLLALTDHIASPDQTFIYFKSFISYLPTCQSVVFLSKILELRYKLRHHIEKIGLWSYVFFVS
jgi:hypothetical protein